MDDWRVLDSVVEYETGWYTGGYDRVEQPDGTAKNYYWADLPSAVVIVAIRGDEIVFVEQYRPTVRESFLELPAGIVEDGESFVEAGARELEEETGYVPGTVEPLQEYWVATGVLRHRRGVVVAEDLAPGDRKLDSNEFLSIETRPIDEAIDAAREAPANDSTLSALLLAEREGYLNR